MTTSGLILFLYASLPFRYIYTYEIRASWLCTQRCLPPAADDPWGAWSSLPPLRVAAKTDVSSLGCTAARGQASMLCKVVEYRVPGVGINVTLLALIGAKGKRASRYLENPSNFVTS